MSETTKTDGSVEQSSGLISVRIGRLKQRLDDRVEAGDFESRSEAIREGTRRVVLEAEIHERDDEDDLVTDGGQNVEGKPACHYCGEDYEPTTSLEKSFHDDPDDHNVCSSCLFDVITDGKEMDPLPRFTDEEADQ